MIVYVTTCNTFDPEGLEGNERNEILGIFSDLASAISSFDRKEGIVERDGVHWIKEHICFQGMHSVNEYELDEWKGETKEVYHRYPYAEMLNSLHIE